MAMDLAQIVLGFGHRHTSGTAAGRQRPPLTDNDDHEGKQHETQRTVFDFLCAGRNAHAGARTASLPEERHKDGVRTTVVPAFARLALLYLVAAPLLITLCGGNGVCEGNGVVLDTGLQPFAALEKAWFYYIIAGFGGVAFYEALFQRLSQK